MSHTAYREDKGQVQDFWDKLERLGYACRAITKEDEISIKKALLVIQ